MEPDECNVDNYSLCSFSTLTGTNLRRRIDGELQFAFLPEVHRQSFHHQRGEAGAGAAAERMKDEEALQTVALLRAPSNSVHARVNDLLADGIMTACVVVRRILRDKEILDSSIRRRFFI